MVNALGNSGTPKPADADAGDDAHWGKREGGKQRPCPVGVAEDGLRVSTSQGVKVFASTVSI